jgi:cell wall-associated NlpC family hydrolase
MGRGDGLGLLVAVTVLALVAAPHAAPALEHGGIGRLLRQATSSLPEVGRPASGVPRPSPRAGRAVAYALAKRGKPYRWGAEGPAAFDCSGLTWAAWRSAGVAIPRTAAGQLAGLPRVRGRLRPGDLVIYRTSGPTRRHVAMVVGDGRMVEAPRSGVPVRLVGLRPGFMGAVRPAGGA